MSRRPALLLAALLCVALSPEVRADEAPRFVRDATPETPGVQSWSVTCSYQEGTNKLEILLPEPLDPQRRYPVVYCLPVNAGTKGNWGHPLTEALAHQLPNRYQAIFVCPSYHRLPWYGDNPARAELRQNRYLLEVVLPFIEKTYPAVARPEGRYLVGFSKSGLGALSLFLRNPEKFHKVAVFENWFGQPTEEQWNNWGFAECYGTRANFNDYDPQHLIDLRKDLLAVGPTRLCVLGGGPGLRLGVDSLMSLLTDRKIPHTEIWNRTMGHTWTSGWLPLAVAALEP
jgi:hypothetical protein